MVIIYYFFIFIFGLITGSFLNAVIYRLEINKSFISGRSFCPNCNHSLRWSDLIPVISFFFLRGKCRYCKKKISWQYPLVELATGILFILIFNFQFFPTASGQAIFPVFLGAGLPAMLRIILQAGNFQNLFSLLYLLIIFCFLIIIFVYDLKHFIIPDKVVYPAIIISLLYNFINSFFIFNNLRLFINNLLAASGAALFFLLIFLISRGRWIGFGDIKLVFFLGLFLGYPNILTALFFAFLIGAVIGIVLVLIKRKEIKSEVPFGPFLTTGALIAFFWGVIIIQWYFNLFLYAR